MRRMLATEAHGRLALARREVRPLCAVFERGSEYSSVICIFLNMLLWRTFFSTFVL